MLVLDTTELTHMEQLRNSGPHQLRERLTNAFRWDEPPKAQVDHLTSLVERICLYLCELYNSYYFEIDDAVEDLEQQLRAMEALRGRYSFGHYISTIRVFSDYFGDSEYKDFPELGLLGRTSMPETVSIFCKKIDIVKKGRSFAIPPHKIDKYVQDQLKGQSAKKIGFMEYLKYVNQIRNAHAHPEGKDWWVEDRQWYRWLNRELQTATKEALMWKPLRNILYKYALVEYQEDITNGDVRKQWELVFKGVGEERFEYALSPRSVTVDRNSISGKEPPERFYVLGPSNQEEFSFQFPHVKFPDKKISHEQRKQNYRRKYIQLYLGVGIIDESARDELAVYQEREALSGDEVKQLQEEVQEKVNKIRDVDSEEEKVELLTKLRQSLGDPDGEQIRDLEEKVEDLDDKIRDAILQKVEDVAVVSYRQLKEDSGFSDEVLNAVLRPLEDEDEVFAFEGLGGEMLYSSALVAPIKNFEQLVKRLNDSNTSLDEIPQRILAKISYDLLPDRTRAVREWFDSTFAKPQSIGDETTEAEEEDTLDLMVDGIEITGDSVRHFFRQVFAAVGDDSRFWEGLPHRMGRTRYLVNVENVHKNGTEFSKPEVCDQDGQSVYFETNLTRWKAHIEVKKFLSSCGFSVSSSLEVAVEDEPEIDTDTGADVEGSDTLKNKLMITIGDTGQEAKLVGGTVGALFTEVLRYIDKRGLLDGKLDALPFYAGRVRLLLADKPVHANGRNFRRVVDRDIEMRNGDVFEAYMEAAFSRDNGLDKAKELLQELGIKKLEAVDWRSTLRVNIEGQETSGSTVRNFVGAVVETLEEQGLDWAEYAPFKMGTQRYLVNDEPVHADGDEFNSEEQIDDYYFEVNMSYDRTRATFAKWLDKMGIEHDLEG